MDFYRKINKDAPLFPGEIGDLCEKYVMGMSINDLAKLFNISNAKIMQYLMFYYYGQIPKIHQLQVTVQSKMNLDDP